MTYPALDLATARKIVNFSGGRSDLESLGEVQLKGAVALYNAIINDEVGLGYLGDEVGMGKTYVALGVVALMRYFKPTLRVLYICPSANVQEKWLREHASFIEQNVCTASYRVRTLEGKPAAPVAKCDSLADLIRTASSGFYADFFVRNGSFSFGLKKKQDENDEEAVKSWRAQREKLKQMVPAIKTPEAEPTHTGVKDEFARALNYVLPTFDLVVIDEAHNFKHSFDSSDRNRVLSQVLGFNQNQEVVGTTNTQQRVRNALLLSATPYDRNIEQLRNQLALVGKDDLLQNVRSVKDRDEIAHFMVRRLNRLMVGDKEYTRNMYRAEWRDGPKAAIELETDEQKLVTALVQKKVGDALGHKHGSPSFQMGMLASFESYGESTRSPRVEFDSDDPDERGSDAQDRNVVGAIVDSFVEANLGPSLPHPKMDSVAEQLADAVFKENRKQLVFVRRVKSVKELKQKLDECYDNWLITYLTSQLESHPSAWQALQNVIEEYYTVRRDRDDRIDEGDAKEGEAGETELRQPPKNDNLFNWFFRGDAPKASNRNGWSALLTPEQVKQSLSVSQRLASPLLDVNWAQLICAHYGLDPDETVQRCLESTTDQGIEALGVVPSSEYLRRFRLAQLFFLNAWVDHLGYGGFAPLREHLEAFLSTSTPEEKGSLLSREEIHTQIRFPTLFSELETHAELKGQLLSTLGDLLEKLSGTTDAVCTGEVQKLLRTLDIHIALVSTTLRTGHGMVDLYLSRLRQGKGDLNQRVASHWIKDFVAELARQSMVPGFSTYRELKGIADELPALLKGNLPGIFELGANEYRRYLSNQLSPIAPIIGATGETNAPGQRSAQARKFRMPGYPLVLVSTNVFQEGEDLHLFCDSVVHFGVSDSPVSIEQKNGRVDRVGSLAQRRLTRDRTDTPGENELIQVSFPHVKESIERVQIRRLSENINNYMESLHEIGSDATLAHEEITEREIADRSEIKPQIKRFLESPFDPAPPTELPHLNVLQQQIDADQREAKANINRARRLMTSALGVQQNVQWPPRCKLKVSESVGEVAETAELSLGMARASGEILCCVVVDNKDRQDNGVKISSLSELSNLMHILSWTTLHRTFAYQTANSCWRLGYDAEMLIGDAEVTVEEDMQALFARFYEQHDPADYYPTSSSKVLQQINMLRREGKVDLGDMSLTVDVVELEQTIGLRFWLPEGELKRSQTVQIWECDGQCIFLSPSVPAAQVRALPVSKVVEYTWERNRKTDVVEFMLNDQQDIVGRCVHPVDSLHWREFVYCAHVLAVEGDRLEYLACEEEQF